MRFNRHAAPNRRLCLTYFVRKLKDKMDKDIVSEAHEVRSRILNYSILTEIELENFIECYFIDNEEKKGKFKEFILSEEFFTFEEKIKIFGKIIKEKSFKIVDEFHKEYDLKDKEELIRKIRYIQEIRNAIAHNHPFRNEKTNEITLKYKHEKKNKEITLNNDFNKEFFNLYHKIFLLLHFKLK